MLALSNFEAELLRIQNVSILANRISISFKIRPLGILELGYDNKFVCEKALRESAVGPIIATHPPARACTEPLDYAHVISLKRFTYPQTTILTTRHGR